MVDLGPKNVKENREHWLTRMSFALRPWFRDRGFAIPGNVRVAIGFPRDRGVSGTTQWPGSSRDGTHQIFIVPTESDPVEVLKTLVHELCHVVAGPAAHHGKAFKKVANGVGLGGPMQSTPDTDPDLLRHLKELVEAIGPGPYPGGALAPEPAQSQGGGKGKTVKAYCDGCKSVIRLSEKAWDRGPPLCGNPDCERYSRPMDRN